jgi:hypothetical protein
VNTHTYSPKPANKCKVQVSSIHVSLPYCPSNLAKRQTLQSRTMGKRRLIASHKMRKSPDRSLGTLSTADPFSCGLGFRMKDFSVNVAVLSSDAGGFGGHGVRGSGCLSIRAHEQYCLTQCIAWKPFPKLSSIVSMHAYFLFFRRMCDRSLTSARKFFCKL